MGAPGSAISVRNLTVRYGDKHALRGASFDMPENKTTVLIGPSGCGKSTTLRCLNAMVHPDGGSVLYRGREIGDYDPVELRRSMGYAIQSVGLIPHLTVEENVCLVPRLLRWTSERQAVRSRELLELVNLDPGEYGPKYPHQLSGGEAQRVGVARALGADPPVLLMDEPFGAVDPLNREILQDEFVRIQRRLRKTVVFVTHDLEEAVRLADHLVVMRDGKVLQAAEPERVLAEPADQFVEKFLGPDRALKRLALFTADRFLRGISDSGDLRWHLDGAGRPLRGEFRRDGQIVIRTIDRSGHTVKPYSSLKECLSRMLSLGMKAIPVLDEDGSMLGEVRYADIEKISLQ